MASFEDLQETVRVLVAERQALHAHDTDRAELESNRLELVRLIDRYLRRAERDAA